MNDSAIDALVCCLEGSLPLVSLSAGSIGRDEVVYRLDEHYGQIECRRDNTVCSQCGGS